MNRNTGVNKKRTKMPNRVDTSLRRKEVESRKIVGRWKSNNIIGKGYRASIVTLVASRIKYLMPDLLDNQKASKTSKLIIKFLKKILLNFRKIITLDNGSEFAKYTEVTNRLKAKCFFVKPCSSW